VEWCDSTARTEFPDTFQKFFEHTNELFYAALVDCFESIEKNLLEHEEIIKLVSIFRTISITLLIVRETPEEENLLQYLLQSNIIEMIVNKIHSNPLNPFNVSVNASREIISQLHESVGSCFYDCVAWIVESRDDLRVTYSTLMGSIRDSLRQMITAFRETDFTVDPRVLDATGTGDSKVLEESDISSIWIGIPHLAAGLFAFLSSLAIDEATMSEVSLFFMEVHTTLEGHTMSWLGQNFKILERLKKLQTLNKYSPEDNAFVTSLETKFASVIQNPIRIKGESIVDESTEKLPRLIESVIRNTVANMSATLPLVAIPAAFLYEEVNFTKDQRRQIILNIQNIITRLKQISALSYELSVEKILMNDLRSLRSYFEILCRNDFDQDDIADLINISLTFVETASAISRSTEAHKESNKSLFVYCYDGVYRIFTLMIGFLLKLTLNDGDLVQMLAQPLCQIVKNLKFERGTQFIRDGLQALGDFVSIDVSDSLIVEAEEYSCGELVLLDTDDSSPLNGLVGISVRLSQLVCTIFLSTFVLISLQQDESLEVPIFSEYRCVLLANTFDLWFSTAIMKSIIDTVNDTSEICTNNLRLSKGLTLVIQSLFIDLCMTNYVDEGNRFFREMRSFKMRSAKKPDGPTGLQVTQRFIELADAVDCRDVLLKGRSGINSNHPLCNLLLSLPSIGGDYIEEVTMSLKNAFQYEGFLRENDIK